MVAAAAVVAVVVVGERVVVVGGCLGGIPERTCHWSGRDSKFHSPFFFVCSLLAHFPFSHRVFFSLLFFSPPPPPLQTNKQTNTHVQKGYATAISVLLTGCLSMVFFGTTMNATYLLGMVNVICAVTLYNAKGLEENVI